MALVQKHLLKCQRLGEMTSTLSLNYKNYLHFSLYIFKHLILLAKRQIHVTRSCPSPLSECKGISFIFQRCERKMKIGLKTQNTIRALFLNRVQE